MILTPETFNELSPPSKKLERIRIDNHSGLYIDNRASGKSLMLRYKSPITFKYRLIKVARYTHGYSITARELNTVIRAAQAHATDVFRGIDPLAAAEQIRAETKAQEQEAHNRITLKQAWLSYCESNSYTKLSASSQAAYHHTMQAVLARIGDTDLNDLDVDSVALLIAGMTTATGNTATAVLRQIEKRELCKPKDKRYLKQPFTTLIQYRPTPRRKNLIPDDELPRFSQWLESGELHLSMAGAIKMQLLTACRVSEVLKMQWEHIDIKRQIVVIPWQNIKTQREYKPDNRDDFEIPLMPLMKAVIEQQMALRRNQWVFPSLYTSNSHPMSYQSINKAMKANGFCTSHGLRRTAATITGGIRGVTELDIKRLLNHAVTGTTGVYVQGQTLTRKREILDLYHSRLTELMTGEKSACQNVPHLV